MIYFNTQDIFLSEYVPLKHNLCFHLTGFTGSTAHGLFFKEGYSPLKNTQCFLWVDGRYHIQARSECFPQVCPINLNLNQTFIESFQNFMTDHALSSLGMGAFSARLSLLLKDFLSTWSVVSLPESAIGLPIYQSNKPILKILHSLSGRSFEKNIQDLKNSAQNFLGSQASVNRCCVVLPASDDTAWLLNARAYHGVHVSSIGGYTFVGPEEVVVFLPEGISPQSIDLENLKKYRLFIVQGDWEHAGFLMKKWPVDHVLYNGSQLSWELYRNLENFWPGAVHHKNFQGHIHLRAHKTLEEHFAYKESYLKSARCIAHTLREIKTNPILKTESAAAEFLEKQYRDAGALDLSFTSIVGTGSHSAIIHYSHPDNTVIKPGSITLIDSGAYYEPGLATDCTRVVFCNPHGQCKPLPWQKEIYTVTLKAAILCFIKSFNCKTTGAEIDGQVRSVVKEYGYDYAHSTGHGLGIHVHEGGHGLSPRSTQPVLVGGAITIEPGIYLENRGGVRIENAALVKEHGVLPSYLIFENMCFVGYEWDLIDRDLLNAQEMEYLRSYESKCRELGTNLCSQEQVQYQVE